MPSLPLPQIHELPQLELFYTGRSVGWSVGRPSCVRASEPALASSLSATRQDAGLQGRAASPGTARRHQPSPGSLLVGSGDAVSKAGHRKIWKSSRGGEAFALLGMTKKKARGWVSDLAGAIGVSPKLRQGAPVLHGLEQDKARPCPLWLGGRQARPVEKAPRKKASEPQRESS